jgi:short-subunit dehydrogenase
MKNALITGATKGMGRAIAIAFAKEGTNLAICSRNEKELAEFKQELLQINARLQIVTSAVDVANKTELLKFAADAEQSLGFISILINNVGIFYPGHILYDDEHTLQKQLDVNLMTAYHLYRYFGKTMMASGEGHIFNTCSVAAINPVVSAGSYTVTKYALLGLTKVMRLETQAKGVKVTAVIPGSTITDSWKDEVVDKDKFVAAEDIASAIINIYNMSTGANVDEIIIRPAGGQV